MKNQDLVKSIRAEIATLRGKGHDAISLGALDSYLGRLEELTSDELPQLDQLALHQAKAQLDFQLAAYQRGADEDMEMFRSVINSGQTARHASMLINGGAAAALLAFVGHVVTQGRATPLVSDLASPLACFLGGVLASAMASGVTYLAQSSWRAGKNRIGRSFNTITIFLVAASYVAFAVGCWLGFNVLRGFQP